jgi:hypothetical protein
MTFRMMSAKWNIAISLYMFGLTRDKSLVECRCTPLSSEHLGLPHRYETRRGTAEAYC